MSPVTVRPRPAESRRESSKDGGMRGGSSYPPGRNDIERLRMLGHRRWLYVQLAGLPLGSQDPHSAPAGAGLVGDLSRERRHRPAGIEV